MQRLVQARKPTGAIGASLLATLVAFLVLAPLASAGTVPSVSAVSPAHGPAGGDTAVVITGTGFTGASEVRFGSRVATSFKVESETQIAAVSPPWGSGNAIAEVTVTTPAGKSPLSTSDSFIYEPAVTKVEPNGGSSGQEAMILGSALSGHYENGASEATPFVKAVRFGARAAQVVSGSEKETSVAALVPSGNVSGSVDVTVETLAGTSALGPEDEYTYTPQPQFLANFVTLSSAHHPVLAFGSLTLETVVGAVTCEDMLQGSVWNQNGHGEGAIEGFSASQCRDPNNELCGLPLPERCSVFVTAEMPPEEELRQAETCAEEQQRLSECPNSAEREDKSLIWRERRRVASVPWKLQLAWIPLEEETVSGARLGGRGQDCYPKEEAVVEGVQTEHPASFEKVPSECVKLDVIVPQDALEAIYYGRLETELRNGAANGLNPSRLVFFPELTAIDGLGRLQLSGAAAGSAPEGEFSGKLKLVGAGSQELVIAR